MVAAIPRTVWQDPARPVTGPRRRARFQRGVVHYEGVNRDVTPADIAQHLRNMQASYLRSRGYSVGYGFATVSDVRHPSDGVLFELRGTDLNMASNPGRKWAAEGRSPSGNSNNWTGSVLLIGPTDVRASAKAAATVRRLFGEWHSEAGTVPQRPLPHSDLDWTSCCGDAYRMDLNAGLFDPLEEDDDMLYAARNRDAGNKGVHVGNGVWRRWVDDAEYSELTASGVKVQYLGSVPASTVRALGRDADQAMQ